MEACPENGTIRYLQTQTETIQNKEHRSETRASNSEPTGLPAEVGFNT